MHILISLPLCFMSSSFIYFKLRLELNKSDLNVQHKLKELKFTITNIAKVFG